MPERPSRNTNRRKKVEAPSKPSIDRSLDPSQLEKKRPTRNRRLANIKEDTKRRRAPQKPTNSSAGLWAIVAFLAICPFIIFLAFGGEKTSEETTFKKEFTSSKEKSISEDFLPEENAQQEEKYSDRPENSLVKQAPEEENLVLDIENIPVKPVALEINEPQQEKISFEQPKEEQAKENQLVLERRLVFVYEGKHLSVEEMASTIVTLIDKAMVAEKEENYVSAIQHYQKAAQCLVPFEGNMTPGDYKKAFLFIQKQENWQKHSELASWSDPLPQLRGKIQNVGQKYLLAQMAKKSPRQETKKEDGNKSGDLALEKGKEQRESRKKEVASKIFPMQQPFEMVINNRIKNRTIRKIPWPGFHEKFFPFSSEWEEKLRFGLNTSLAQKMTDEYVDSFEKACVKEYSLNSDFIEWLQKKKKLRETFWQAIAPQYDDIPRAVQILDQLRQESPDKVERFYHLATALALVWDSPGAISSSRYNCIWGYTDNQFPEILSFEEIFKIFTQKRSKFLYSPSVTPWPFLIHVVNLDITKPEYQWATKKYYKRKKNIYITYKEVPYDTEKYTTGVSSFAGDYTLPNILKNKGICGEQAHFSSRLAKSFAIPAMKISGKNRYGSHHAWTGYLTTKKGKLSLEFEGRYQSDMYYTGKVYDPQLRIYNLDRFLAMKFAGVAQSYSKFMTGSTLTKIAQMWQSDSPKVSSQIVQYALRTNPLEREAWDLLLVYIENQEIPQKEALKWLNMMLESLTDHPDLTMDCLENFLKTIDDFDKRQDYYNRVFRLYKDRPDLEIRLRLAQFQDLYAAGEYKKAIHAASETCLKNANEGSLVIPLIRKCVNLAKAKGLRNYLKPRLKEIQAKFPKSRGGKTARSYQELQEMMGGI